MARTYRTLSLSLPPDVVATLTTLGAPTGRVAARVAAEIVLREVLRPPVPVNASAGRSSSWCCAARVVPVQGPLVMPETPESERRWMPVIVLLCVVCHKQMHGREYEGWIGDA